MEQKFTLLRISYWFGALLDFFFFHMHVKVGVIYQIICDGKFYDHAGGKDFHVAGSVFTAGLDFFADLGGPRAFGKKEHIDTDAFSGIKRINSGGNLYGSNWNNCF